MSNTLIINGVRKDKMMLAREYKIQTGNVDLVTADVVGNSRKIYKRIERSGVETTLPIIYLNKYNEVMKTKEEIIDELVKELKFGEGEELRIGATGSEFYGVGYFTGIIEAEDVDVIPSSIRFDVGLTYTDAFRYSRELKTYEVNDKFTVENKHEEVEPVLRLTASGSSQYLRVFNETMSEGLLVGDDDIRDTKQEELKIYGMSGLNGLENMSTKGNHLIYESGLLKPLFDNLGGELRYRHTLSKDVRDFSSVTTFRTMGVEPGQKSTSYVHYKDSDGGIVATLEMVVDPNAPNVNLRGKAHVRFRVRSASGSGMVTLLEFSGDDYNRVFDDADLSVRISRIGNTYTLKTWKYSRRDGAITGRHTARWKDSTGSRYSDQSISSFDIGFIKDGRKPTSELGFVNLEMSEIVNGDSPHYDIVKAGDEIIIDNQKRLITINGEPAIGDKDIYSKYVKLGRGYNSVSIQPSGLFSGTLEFNERKI